MRLRNLFEVQVQPGERRGFSLRLKRLEDLQVKIAEIQNTISELGNVSVPENLKKQMEDLIDAAKIEKEKIYAEVSDAEVKNPRIQGIPGSVMKLLRGIEKNASTIMNAYRKTGKYLYRGIKSSEDALYGKPFDIRKAKDSNVDLSNALNQSLADQGFNARRDNTTFTSGSYNQASNYGTVYIIFPRDGFSFHYSKKIRDLVLDTGKIDMLLDPEITGYIESAIRSNWSNLKNYFSYKFSGDKFFTGYEYQKDLDGLQRAVADGVLPQEFAKYKTFYDLVDPAKVIANFQYNQTDLDSAITSEHEVMITGPYYAVKTESFQDYIDKYIKMTANGEFDVTPDNKKEKTTLNQKIQSIVGGSAPEFAIGDWVQHKYEGFKGEVVDYYHTNDFVQIKDYAGKLKLVNKKNIDKIKTPEMPDYQPGDKVYLRTKDTEWEYYNNKKYKVVDSDKFTVTVQKGSYDTTITLPKLLTEPAPKFDTKDPSVGDTVHVTKGDFENMYGTITYVSSYSKDIDVDFGDSDSHTVQKGSYEVIDPATKPADANSIASKFKEGDYVRISDDGFDYSGLVAVINKPGLSKSRVYPFGEKSYALSIKNSRLKAIDEDEFKKQSFSITDQVVVSGGKHDGKSGKLNYVSFDGTMEIVVSSGNTIEVPGKYVFNQNVNGSPENNENKETIKKGDFVKISDDSDLFPGSVAKVVVKNSGEKSTILVNNDNNLDYIIDTKYLTKIDENEFNNKKLSTGDEVNVTDGYYKGKTGKIKSFGTDGPVRVDITSPSTGDTFTIKVLPQYLEKINQSSDDLIDLMDLEFEPMDEPTDFKNNETKKFKVGDSVKVINGKHKGKTGKINYLYTYTKEAYVDFDGEYHDIELKDLELDKEESKTDSNFNKDELKKLISQGKEKGFITYNQLNDVVPSDKVTSEEIEDIMDMLNELGINLVDAEKDSAPSGETPQELQARINDPDTKAFLKQAFADPDVKELVSNIIKKKIITTDDIDNISVLVGYDKYLFGIKPYIELKGVVYQPTT
jgi:ribosomal protein L24